MGFYAIETAVTGSSTVQLQGAETGLQRVAFWVGVRTPVAGSALQARLLCVDRLGFTTETPSALLSADAVGSIQGYFSASYDGSSAYTWVVDYLGAPGVEYDYEVDQKGM